MTDAAHRTVRPGALCVGWREWVSLPGLAIPYIKAKVDTGARTSALHTFALESYQDFGRQMVRFSIHPLQKRDDVSRHCSAEVIDRRWVTDSGGHREFRYIIRTPLRVGDREWPIEITLTSRETMRFRMLLGRTAMQHNFVVVPEASYLLGRPREEVIEDAYTREEEQQ